MNVFEKAMAAIGVCLVVAVIMIVLVGRKRKDPAAAKLLWKKFFVYLALIGVMMCAIHFRFLFVPVTLIIATGFGEMLFVASKAKAKPLTVIFSLIVFLFFAFGFGLLTQDHESNVLTLFSCIIIFDGFSQLFGQLFGKMKLLPSVSPEKTIEGFLGGLLMIIPVSWWLQPDVTLLYAILFSVIFAVVALTGDLLASKYKRICGVKDYSRILPGHGGILDRFDGFIAVGAVWMYVSLLVFYFSAW